MLKKIILWIWLLLFLACGLWGSEVSLFSLLRRVNGWVEWDPSSDTGVIISGKERISFRTGFPVLLYNYKEKIEAEPVAYRNGEIMFPEKTAEAIVKILRREESVQGVMTEKPKIAAVLLDPGHGGKDSGAIGTIKEDNGDVLKIQEKDLVLSVSNQVFDLLSGRYPDKKILRTREDDTYPTLEERVEMANNITLRQSEAIIFVSIHANASLNSGAKGFEVWYLPPEYRRDLIDPETMDPDAREILPILNTMLEEEYTVESVILAQRILQGIEAEVGDVSFNRGLKDETWYVVRNANMPSVLVEIGFITNQEEARRMNDPAHLKALSRGIYNGICDFIDYFEQTSGFTE